MESIKAESFFGNILKGVGVSIIFTVIALTFFSLLLVYTNINENLIQPVVIGVTGISILMGSFFANKNANKNGIINGCIIGFLYIIVIYLISSFANNMNFSVNLGTIIMIISGIIGGAIGGIIGVNV